MDNNRQDTLIVGISGVSSSGKTTLARLLRDVLAPAAFVLHEDDFYLPDADIPVVNGVQDWDCLEALDLVQLQRCLQHIKVHGAPPPDFASKEDANSVGECAVNEAALARVRDGAAALVQAGIPRIAIVDGFLLYSESMRSVWEQIDARLLLRTSYATAKARRERRSGYVTLDGFWQDPPGYVDKIVWPHYVADHAFLFRDGNVEGEFDTAACAAMRLWTVPDGAQGDMGRCLEWAFGAIAAEIERRR